MNRVSNAACHGPAPRALIDARWQRAVLFQFLEDGYGT